MVPIKLSEREEASRDYGLHWRQLGIGLNNGIHQNEVDWSLFQCLDGYFFE